ERALDRVARAQVKAPSYQVDPMWPKLPKQWILGQVSGLDVDAQDHVWIIQRPWSLNDDEKAKNPEAECCREAPPVMEFDAAGNYVYPKTNEVFVADGYVNRRVMVLDADTGKFKRMWGAYGNTPDDNAPNKLADEGPGPQQFNTVHGVQVSDDGTVYVADR